jgi:chemotaxis protein MotB
MKQIFLSVMLLFAIHFSMTSCKVENNKKYKAMKEGLEKRLSNCQEEVRALKAENKSLKDDTTSLGQKLREWMQKYRDLERRYQDQTKKLADVEDNYKKLKSQSSQEVQDLIRKLEKLQQNLQDVQNKLAARDSALKALRERIRQALMGFENSGLTVTEKNGKIYVSLSNQLLFESGRYDLNKRGKEAILQLSNVLVQQPDIQIQVEGHTDSENYKSGVLVDNWDLSVKRSTEVVRFMVEQGKVAPQRLTASGHGEFMPVASNETSEGRSQNRRTDIILVPNLEDVFKILDQD